MVRQLTAAALAAAMAFAGVASAVVIDGVDSPTGIGHPTPPEGPPIDRPAGGIFLNFDEIGQPCVFSETVALTTEYAASGVTFSGPGPLNGGGVLDECGNFGVSGQSSPNFLAFNCGSGFSDGGIPDGPERLDFDGTVSNVSAIVGSAGGGLLSMDAYNSAGDLIGSDSVALGAALQLIEVAADGISYVIIGVDRPCVWVLDDLAYELLPTPVTETNWSDLKDTYRD